MASPNGRCHPKPNNHVLRVHSNSFISFRPPETSWNFNKSKNVRASVFLGDIKSWSQWSLFKLHHHHPTTPPQKKKFLSHLTDNRRFPTTPSLRPRNLLGSCHHFLGGGVLVPLKHSRTSTISCTPGNLTKRYQKGDCYLAAPRLNLKPPGPQTTNLPSVDPYKNSGLWQKFHSGILDDTYPRLKKY